ncbi:hypothetical protein BDZ45DRAFT_742494 [Acephala macrosclerotiorum]|nr:hypothetical protein BDZ45DRAFT_742494 [Acephala macrosclerotiorum]
MLQYYNNRVFLKLIIKSPTFYKSLLSPLVYFLPQATSNILVRLFEPPEEEEDAEPSSPSNFKPDYLTNMDPIPPDANLFTSIPWNYEAGDPYCLKCKEPWRTYGLHGNSSLCAKCLWPTYRAEWFMKQKGNGWIKSLEWPLWKPDAPIKSKRQH